MTSLGKHELRGIIPRCLEYRMCPCSLYDDSRFLFGQCAERARIITYRIVLLLIIIVFDLIAKEEQMVSSVKYLCKASYIEM